MATKTITITSEAYERLFAFKEPNESFSDVITKIMRKYSFLDLVGILSPGEAEKLEKNIKEIRKRMRDQLNKTALKLE
ncbi:antitoxin VapB family protein [Candidatus Pacearchaeota archaeon]|nr:antitoxin VapB family protein [Candidatus Pacearchaeota archaeon]